MSCVVRWVVWWGWDIAVHSSVGVDFFQNFTSGMFAKFDFVVDLLLNVRDVVVDHWHCNANGQNGHNRKRDGRIADKTVRLSFGVSIHL